MTMRTSYTIWAYSPTLNSSHRRFDLANIHVDIVDPQVAQRDADAFASIYNRDRKENVQDWVGQIKLEELGISTLFK
jgi:hypothetical protein